MNERILVPYSEFKARRDQQELEKKKIIDLVQFLNKKHNKPEDAA